MYDVLIIGSGTAGLTARKVIAKETDNYLVVDNGVLGTTCARVGCMPSKVLIQVANDFHRRNKFESLGIEGGDKLTIDILKVMKHVRALRDRFVGGVMKGFESWRETHLVQKKATFIDANTIDLEGEVVKAKKIIIATGSRPLIPAPWKEYSEFFLDTDQFFEQENFPKKMAVIGLGVIGIELGQALHRLGVDLIAISDMKSIGGLGDPEMIDYVAKTFESEMQVDFEGVKKFEKVGGQLKIITGKGEYLVDKALVAIGRRPMIADLNLEVTGAKLDERGMPLFDGNTLKVEGASIFIAGDSNGYRPLLHEAADEGSIAGFNVLCDDPQCFKRRTFLGITFCAPNICTVGEHYKDLENFEEGSVSFEAQGRAVAMVANNGLMKVYGEKKTGRLLGAEIFGPTGEHIAHLLAWAIQKEMTVHEILQMPFYHPSIEEGLRAALRELAGKVDECRPALEVARCQEHPTERS